MLTLLSILPLAIGVVILAYSLKPTNHIISTVPSGSVCHKWKLLRILISFFILSYISFLLFIIAKGTNITTSFIAIVFMVGAGFVYMVCQLALSTVNDIKRITVLEQENTIDDLMGIYNRRYFDSAIQDEFTRAKRYKLPLSLLVLDLDLFKQFNDNYGHQVGDEVLKFFGELMKSSTRDTDIVARFGGEEIAIILPNTNLQSALVCAEKLRSATELTPIHIDDLSIQKQLSITTSIGLSEVTDDIDSSWELFKRADEALYLAKENGRNCIKGA